MGTQRGKKFLRLLACIDVVVMIAVYFAPKAC